MEEFRLIPTLFASSLHTLEGHLNELCTRVS